MNKIRLPRPLLERTFQLFRGCGSGRRECQVLWTSRLHAADDIDAVDHPSHASHQGGFIVSDEWLTKFWLDLAAKARLIRVQVHTHPRDAFHSRIDDLYPIVHSVGFLSLVIPDFGTGPVGFAGAYLTEIGQDGTWHRVNIESRLEIVDERATARGA